jgi:hypothetical protein
MITVILLYTNALDLNLVMFRAYELFEISSQPVPIQIVQPQKDWMPSGEKLETALILVRLKSQPRICVPTSDAQNGNIGEGVEEILNMRRGKSI